MDGWRTRTEAGLDAEASEASEPEQIAQSGSQWRAFGVQLLVWRASDDDASERQSPSAKRLNGQASTQSNKRAAAL